MCIRDSLTWVSQTYEKWVDIKERPVRAHWATRLWVTPLPSKINVKKMEIVKVCFQNQCKKNGNCKSLFSAIFPNYHCQLPFLAMSKNSYFLPTYKCWGSKSIRIQPGIHFWGFKSPQIKFWVWKQTFTFSTFFTLILEGRGVTQSRVAQLALTGLSLMSTHFS